MEISKTRYVLTLTAQIILIFFDLLFNTFSANFSWNNAVLLLIFLLQDFIQLLAFVLMLITFFQTNVFQAGFMVLLYEKFWPVITVSFLYIVLSVLLHAWILIIGWNSAFFCHWPIELHCCFTIHRLTCAVYYYVYKRTTLLISDPRLYEDEWINHMVHHRNL